MYFLQSLINFISAVFFMSFKPKVAKPRYAAVNVEFLFIGLLVVL